MKKIVLLLSVSFFLSEHGYANAARGLEIAKAADKQAEGFGNQVADVEMILKNKQGQTSTRQMIIKSLEVKGDGDKSLTIFKSPKDVKGTSFLSFSHVTGPDEQWLYLPALKRVKRISSNNKSGPFMGSEFAYEDLSSQEVEKYTYKFIEEGELNGRKTFVIERYPADKKSGYTKQVVTMDAETYRTEKVLYYDRKEALLKTLVFTGYKKYPNGKWRADQMSVVNHQSGKSTVLNWKDYSFSKKLKESDFNKNALKRMR